MAILHKGKRKIKYNEKLYLWNIVRNRDDCEYYLRITSEDKKLSLSYRVNQINDYYIHPKIIVIKSDTLKKGTYSFFPPLADEIISNHNVRAILNWHTNHTNSTKPFKD